MAVTRTFSIIKPDATRRNLTGAVTKMLEEAGLFHPGVVGDRRVRIDGEAGGQANGDLLPGTHGRGGAIVVGETRPRFTGFAVDVVGAARLDGLSGLAGA